MDLKIQSTPQVSHNFRPSKVLGYLWKYPRYQDKLVHIVLPENGASEKKQKNKTKKKTKKENGASVWAECLYSNKTS